MGHRTISLVLVFRALFLDPAAYEELREDDNPFVEGLFLVALIAVITALLHLVGQLVAWASVPQTSAIKGIVLTALQTQPWWQSLAGDPQASAIFQRAWDAAWQISPVLFGVPDPAAAALNVIVWPVWALAGWLLYGSLAHMFARLLRGQGSYSQTLGVTALAFTPWLLRGLEFVPFLVVGGVINSWQLLLRYRALRTVHRLSWSSAAWATVLPFAVYLVFWLLLGAGFAAVIAAIARR